MKNKLLGFDLNELVEDAVQNVFESTFTDKNSDELAELLKQKEMEKANSREKKRFSKKEAADVGDEGIEPTEAKPVKVKHEQLPDVDANSIIDKINEIRAGKSLKDGDTKASLKAYFQKLNGPERIALFAFLSGLAKVLGEQSKNVKTPHSKPFSIDMEQDKDIGSSGKVQNKQQGTKDISSTQKSENPIIVGESQDKRNILKAIRSKRSE